MLLSKNEHNVRNKYMEDWNVTKPGFVECFKTPTVGSKDGSYFLMGHCTEPKRSAQNMKEANLIILDCDSRLDKNLNVIQGAPPVEQACNVLKESPRSCLLYTTFSHRKDYPRYRIVFFPDVPVKPEDVGAVTKAMFEWFNKKGVPLACTSESSRISQPWFFPRVRDKKAEYICRIRIEGEELHVEKILSEVPQEEKLKKLNNLKKLKNLRDSPDDTWSPIDMFLQTNTLDYIDALLDAHGYKKKYATTDGFRYLAPGSKSGVHGVVLFKGRDSKWRVYSHHINDPLALVDKETKEPHALDAYDVWEVLVHTRDSDRALDELKKQHHKLLQKCFLDRFVYIIETHTIGDRNTGLDIGTMSQFKEVTKAAYWIAASGDPTKAGKRISAADDWLSNRERVTAIKKGWIISKDRTSEERTYICDEDKDINGVPQLYWNGYNAPEWDEIKSEDYLHFFLDHIKYLIPDKDDCELFIMWLAERFQYPLDRARFTPLHISKVHGVGRGWIVDLMDNLMGSENCSCTTMHELAGRGGGFNEHLNNTRLCSLPEVYEKEKGTSKYSINAEIRSTLTDTRLQLNTKYGFKGRKRVYTSFFMMSNEVDCLIIPKEDRRMFVMNAKIELMPEEYYGALHEQLDNKQFLREVFWYLNRLDITRIRRMVRAPENEARAGLVGMGLSKTETQFNTLIDKPIGLVWTCQLVQVYVNILEKREGYDTYEGYAFPVASSRASNEIEKLFNIGLDKTHGITNIRRNTEALRFDKRRLAGGNIVRVRVHDDFPMNDRNKIPKLQKELEKTVKAVYDLLAEITTD